MAKQTRREILISSLGLAVGGCVSSPKKLLSSDKSDATNASNPVHGSEVPLNRKPSNDTNQLALRLSKPWSKMKNHYHCVVVGSGYGASVIAARLASHYKDLAVLERGKEWYPGDFPETWSEFAGAIKTGLTPLGLFDVESGKDIDIICGNGLGGTSLINAAIAIRPELNVFAEKEWPKEIQEAARSGELESYYQRAESVLQPQKMGQMQFLKSKVHQNMVAENRGSHGELSLNIRNESYSPQSANAFGYPQGPCQECGNCCTGCNFGAKNVLPANYLSIAARNGAQIFTQVEVLKIEKVDAKYELTLRLIPMLGYTVKRVVTADHVFLGAGAKGSTQILMRSRSKQFTFSNALGTRLSANGDVMGMAYNTDTKTNIVAKKKAEIIDVPLEDRPGLIISTYANYRSPSMDNQVQSQFLLLDGVVPSALAPWVANAFAAYANAKQDKFNPSKDPVKQERIKKDLHSVGVVDEEGALNHSMLYFACGHDSSGGRFIYNRKLDTFDYTWPGVLKEATFQRINGVMKKYAESKGGVFIENPRATVFDKKIQATHPLGGCPMGDSTNTGVVNHLGQVFDAAGGVHANLYVVDASTLPRSLSATPLLTITALAERIAANILSLPSTAKE